MILLQIIFFSGILLSVQYNNKLTLKLSVILLLFSIIFNCTRENYNYSLNDCIDNNTDTRCIAQNKFKCDKTNLTNSTLFKQCIRNPVNVSGKITEDGTTSNKICINNFNKDDPEYTDIRPCENIGCVIFDKNPKSIAKSFSTT